MNMPAYPEWRPVAGTGYEVSSSGLVRAGDRLLKQWANNQGYMLVRLSRPRKVVRVHRLVADAFIPNAEGKPYVNHIDCVRSHNDATNLEWCTQLENLKHAERLGRMQRDYWVGKRSPNARLTDAQAEKIRAEYAIGNISWQALGAKHGVSKRSVGRIVKGQAYTSPLSDQPTRQEDAQP